MTKKETAESFFEKGYSCVQSVLMAFCEDFGISLQDAAKLTCGLGGGIAKTRETCGAVLGGIMVLGLAFSNGSAGDKKKLYEISQNFISDFQSAKGSSICRVLLGLDEDVKEDSAPSESYTTFFLAQY